MGKFIRNHRDRKKSITAQVGMMKKMDTKLDKNDPTHAK